MTAQLVPLTSVLRGQVDPRRCDFDRLADVDLEVGGRVRDGLVAENLAAFLPDPAPPGPEAARTCSAITIAGRAATARRRAEIRTAWADQRRGRAMTAQPVRPVETVGRERTAALHVLSAPCLWARACRFVDDAGEVDWLRLELAAGQWSYADWLLVRAAHDLDDGTATAGLRRLCTTLAPHALRRVLEAIAILRPDAAPKGWSR